MTIEQLYCFLEVYHYRSITKAAANLNISRQAVSNSIKKLESEFNVVLFDRSASGAAPTKAGEELYKHASVIIRETSAINENLSHCDEEDQPQTTCRIGLAEALLLTFGEKLDNILSETFPKVYFDVSVFEYHRDEKDQYKNYDIAVPVLFDQQYHSVFDGLDDNYVATELEQIPVYVWIAEDSPYNQYDVLNFSILKDAPCCTLKNSYNINNLIRMMSDSTSRNLKWVEEIYLKNNFVNCIEKFGYFAMDYKVVNHSFFYDDLLKGHRVVLKPTNYVLYKSVIYNKDICQNIYPIVVDVLA